jgi:hypothetical protein
MKFNSKSFSYRINIALPNKSILVILSYSISSFFFWLKIIDHGNSDNNLESHYTMTSVLGNLLNDSNRPCFNH